LFFRPTAAAVDRAGNVYIADAGNNRIQMFTSGGAFLGKWGEFGSGNGQFKSPYGVAATPAGVVYVSDYVNARIQKFGDAVLPAERATWGGIKKRYR
jgi:DNA-binding beta-propeller fold protein YncE